VAASLLGREPGAGAHPLLEADNKNRSEGCEWKPQSVYSHESSSDGRASPVPSVVTRQGNATALTRTSRTFGTLGLSIIGRGQLTMNNQALTPAEIGCKTSQTIVN
jgi:hypothetical protein